MSAQSGSKKVYVARSLEDVRRILTSNDKKHIKHILYRAFISLWVLAANGLLRILQFILFKKRGYSRKEFKDIVIYTAGILGDNVVLLPAIAAIKKRYPNANTTVISDMGPYPKAPTEIFNSIPFIDRLIVLNDHPVLRIGRRLRLDPKINGVVCDLFVNLAPYGNRGWLGAIVREMIFARWIGARFAIGFSISTKMPGKDVSVLNSLQHYFVKNEPCRSGSVLQELALAPVEGEDLLPRSQDAKDSVLNKLKIKGCGSYPLFVIHPGANLKAKQWPPEKFGEAAKFISQHYNAKVIVTGTSSERSIADVVVKASDGTAINIAGETSIHELIELLRMGEACVTNDTGTMHLAAMIGLPTVSIFGTRIAPTCWIPNGDKVASLFCLMGCSYCYDDYCSSPDCMNSIEVHHVIRATQELLKESNQK